ncbi:uncharacterized protein Tco025E_08711 [Trypanosoma conorhini]|uniref:Uncharacterized protein n=1 Tax=Trypanosoma conorhini TaxID=83891 RepID=A0A3R7ND70_9TRYP|nr:uncharacterized protein Tco025E_08711 [Trypanosoma conorhini]RNF00934.1 hypothetical protein Tco025E_08711 [Trypanosoma conorhini]
MLHGEDSVEQRRLLARRRDLTRAIPNRRVGRGWGSESLFVVSPNILISSSPFDALGTRPRSCRRQRQRAKGVDEGLFQGNCVRRALRNAGTGRAKMSRLDPGPANGGRTPRQEALRAAGDSKDYHPVILPRNLLHYHVGSGAEVRRKQNEIQGRAVNGGGCRRHVRIGEKVALRRTPIQYVLTLHAQNMGRVTLQGGDGRTPIAVSGVEVARNDVYVVGR